MHLWSLVSCEMEGKMKKELSLHSLNILIYSLPEMQAT